MTSKARSGISSNLLTGLIVGTFVLLVALGLVFANFGYLFSPGNTTTQSQGIEVTAYQLFSGSRSSISYTGACAGDSYLVVYLYNNTPNAVHITNVTIYGSSLSQNASTLITVSGNSCVPLSQGNPELPPGSDYEFVGYLTTSLSPLTNCYFLMQLDNGQQFSHLMVAQV